MAYRINYNQVMRQADKIDSEAAEIQAVIRDLDTLLNDIRSIWKGKASDSFYRECLELKTQMQKSKIQIQNKAEKIRYMARKIKEADDRAAEASKQLNS